MSMAVHQPFFSPRLLKGVVAVMAISIASYIVVPPLYWHFAEGLAAVSSSSSTSCASCAACDCSSQPLLALPHGLTNASFADCGKRDPEVSEEMEKNFTDLLSEELKLREAEALESQRRADMSLLEAKKMASQYQKEADKCNSGMETCGGQRKSRSCITSPKEEVRNVGDESPTTRMETRIS